MKYIVENWSTEETIKTFNSEEERQEWLNENTSHSDDGCFLPDGTRVGIYEIYS